MHFTPHNKIFLQDSRIPYRVCNKSVSMRTSLICWKSPIPESASRCSDLENNLQFARFNEVRAYMTFELDPEQRDDIVLHKGNPVLWPSRPSLIITGLAGLYNLQTTTSDAGYFLCPDLRLIEMLQSTTEFSLRRVDCFKSVCKNGNTKLHRYIYYDVFNGYA